ncbi:MAG: malonyl-CoA decarboxylase [Thermoanaerobaculia bacterium]
MALAREILDAYARLPEEKRLAFLTRLADRYGPDPARLERAVAAYSSHPGPRPASDLHAAAEPRRQELIRRLNLAPGGTLGLVRMREDLLRELPAHRNLEILDRDFVQLFSSWFNRGFLVLKPVNWSSPAHILEKVIRYEAVHAITGWKDLQRRIEPGDRRCFAFHHPALDDEPLIFVEVALTDHVPEAIAPLLSEDRKPIPLRRATTAVFYSISSCQAGLRGISFGNFLIKQVVEELQRDVPSLRTFVTLSPVSGFVEWLRRDPGGRTQGGPRRRRPNLLAFLDRPGWETDPESVRAVRKPLTGALARYFLVARGPAGLPLDRTARFHLGNGARLERLNFQGDPSPKGLSEAAGFMVNYLYDLGRIERNHELYANRRQVVASRAVRRLLGAASE